MSEPGFRILNAAFSVGAELVYALFLTAFFHPFLTAQGGKRRKLLIVFCIYILFELVCNQAALQEERASLYAEHQQTQAIRTRIHEAEQFYSRIRQLKHEMRGHLTNIKGLARSGEYASLDKARPCPFISVPTIISTAAYCL